MDVHLTLLGGFSVSVDGVAVPDDAWSRRQAAALVKLLALAPGRGLHREQVIDALWPDTTADQAGPRLHKAAHYARRALGGDARTVVLRNDLVALAPDGSVTTDAAEFTRRGEAALADGSVEAAETALRLYAGPLLPGDLYESWTEQPREALGVLRADLQRRAGRWEDLLEDDPTDEAAHLALARAQAEAGDVRAALRQLERMDQALRRELGTVPSPAAQQLRASLLDPARESDRPRVAETRLVGRRGVGDEVRARLGRADDGHGSTLLVTGPPGVGKSAVLDMAVSLAGKRGWRTGRGTASAIEGPWPYAPVLEAFADLSRQHPTLLDGLDDDYRNELDRALAGREVTWSGESGHQRLFVAAAELLRLAAAGRGLLLAVDDVHEADEATLRLLHYLARCAVGERVVIVLAHRFAAAEALQEMRASLVARGLGTRIDLSPLDERATRRLLAHQFPELDDAAADRIWAVSGGLPYGVLELARTADAVGVGLPPAVQRTFQRVAMLGLTFSTDELLAVSGVPEETAYRHLELAVAGLVVEQAESGYRFRHALVREGLLEALPPHLRVSARREVAERLEALGASPLRVAHQFLEAGQPIRAIPHVLPAVETAGALGAYRDALALVDAVLEHATGPDRAHLTVRRGDLQLALGHPEATVTYREAVALTTGTEHRLVRARLARAASLGGDVETATAALAGLETEGDGADGPVLLARGHLAYFTGDLDAAWEAATEARAHLASPDDPWQYTDLVMLQGLIAHHRGEWFERFRMELRRTRGRSGLATALFDAHLCVAEYLLYGPLPYPEVIELAEGLRGRANQDGGLRGAAFATALIGEAGLLMGDLDLAERELQEAVDLHRDIDARAGEAHSLQRLAEVRLARGDRPGAQELLRRALPLARWSAIANHLLQRIYGTMIAAAEDPEAAYAVVGRAEATMGQTDACKFCDVMLAVPAAIACAEVGELAQARRHLGVAQRSSARREGDAWNAAILEAEAHLAHASGEVALFGRLIDEAGRLFTVAGQPLDAARCARTAAEEVGAALQRA